MHFGKWIVIAFAFFTIFIGTLVTLCIREDISLVSKDYYKEELVYQSQIQRLNNTQNILEKPVITLVGQELQVTWGKKNNIERGELKLFCPSDAKRDLHFSLQHSNRQSFKTTSLKKGLYKVKLLWTMEGKEYYYEQEIYVG